MKARTSKVQVMVQGFLTGMPECNLVVNDSKMIDQRRRLARGSMVMPPHQATIRMSGVQLHPSVDQEAFNKDLQLKFRCMEGVRYEAMRFTVCSSCFKMHVADGETLQCIFLFLIQLKFQSCSCLYYLQSISQVTD